MTKSSLILIFSLSTISASASSKDLRFSKACKRGTQVTVSAVGDILLHKALQRQAYNSRNSSKTNWLEAIPFLKASDIAYGNLEGPVAPGLSCGGKQHSENISPVADINCNKSRRSIYTGYPQFNYHPSLITDLLDSGIDVVSTANNHSLDRRSLGVDKTVKTLNRYGMPFTGMRESKGSRRAWHVVTQSKGKNIAWLSCTESTNGFKDRSNQVLKCFNNGVAKLVRSLSKKYAAVIVTPHWGSEYSQKPNKKQKTYSKIWLDAGATAVLGAHPHVIQPWEKYITKDGRETLIVYSLGNFVSNQGPPNGQGHKFSPKQATAVVYMGLTFSDGKSWINGVRYVPAYMRNRHTKYKKLQITSLKDSPNKQKPTLSLLSKHFGSERRSTSVKDLKTNMECR